MSKQRAGERSRGGRIDAKIAERGGLGVARRDSTQKAKIGTTCRALFWFEAFWVHLDGLARIFARGSEPDPECRLGGRKFLNFITNNNHRSCRRGQILELRKSSISRRKDDRVAGIQKSSGKIKLKQ